MATAKDQPVNLALVKNKTQNGISVGEFNAAFSFLEQVDKEISITLDKVEEESQALKINELNYLKFQKVIDNHLIQLQNSPKSEDKSAVQRNLNEIQTSQEELIKRRKANMQEYEQIISKNFEKSIEYFTKLVNQIVHNIMTWKVGQIIQIQDQNISTGSDFLDAIQKSCEKLAKLLWKFHQALNRTVHHQKTSQIFISLSLKELQENLLELLQTLIQESLIIEVQPPRIWKLRTPSQIEPFRVRFLIGNCSDLHFLPGDVTVSLLGEEDAFNLAQNPNSVNPISSKVLMNYMQTFKYTAGFISRVQATFKNLMVMKSLPQREIKEMTKMWNEWRHWLFVKTQCSISDLKFNLWTLSVPFYIITDSSQSSLAWGTVVWNDASTRAHNLHLPPKVFETAIETSWLHLAKELNKRWRHVCQCDLTEEQISCLRRKISGLNNSTNGIVSLSQFSKDFLPDRTFTFWQWFYEALHLLEVDDTLKSLWQNGFIHGFISRQETEARLSEKACELGTIIIRFSDSCIGGISISFLHKKRKVYHNAPWNAEELRKANFLQKLQELPYFQHVYPNKPIPKPDGFDNIVEPLDMRKMKTKRQGYVRALMRFVMPGITDSLIDDADTTMNPANDDVSQSEREENKYVLEYLSEELQNLSETEMMSPTGSVAEEVFRDLNLISPLDPQNKNTNEDIQETETRVEICLDTSMEDLPLSASGTTIAIVEDLINREPVGSIQPNNTTCNSISLQKFSSVIHPVQIPIQYESLAQAEPDSTIETWQDEGCSPSVYTNLDLSTKDSYFQQGSPAPVSSRSTQNTNVQLSNFEQSMDSHTTSSEASGDDGHVIEKKARRKTGEGFIMNKRARDKSKSKRKITLAKWAQDLTKTCGTRVFLMVEDKILCDSMDGGEHAIDIPGPAKKNFAVRRPVTIPDSIITRLQKLSLASNPPVPENSRRKFCGRMSTGERKRQIEILKTPNVAIDRTCQKCLSKIDPFSPVGSTLNSKWLKCNIDLCNYFVHVNCVGIFIKKGCETGDAIQFFCPVHLISRLEKD